MGIDAIPTPLDDFFRWPVFFRNYRSGLDSRLDRTRLHAISQFFGNLQGNDTPATIGETHHTLGQQLPLRWLRPTIGVASRRQWRTNGRCPRPSRHLAFLSKATQQGLDDLLNGVITANVEAKEEKEQNRPLGLGLSHLMLDHHAHHRPQTGAELLVGHLENPTIFLDQRSQSQARPTTPRRPRSSTADTCANMEESRPAAARCANCTRSSGVQASMATNGDPLGMSNGKDIARAMVSDINSYCKRQVRADAEETRASR